MENKILYCYKMTHDTGFAPNTDHGVLTLATCKPRIRKCAKEGYWISGWTSNDVQGKQEKFSFEDKDQRLIYIAKVSEVMKIEDYWHRYRDKRPKKLSDGTYDKGDNIYEPDDSEELHFRQLPNGGGHVEKNKARDLSGLNVLICKEYYYFGVENAVKIEKDYVVHRWKKITDDRAEDIICQAKHNAKLFNI
ncbi:MAG: hypothetical protein IKS33_00170 [Bacteroidales bacterium]|nr:hypothetical protein [Bacteroidales bacterium]